MDDLLSSIYFNPEHESSFSSADKLYKSAKLIDSNVTLPIVKNFLSKQNA